MLVYLAFLFVVFRGIEKLPKEKMKSAPSEFISVIIPFRNESENILNSLQSISTQEYPSNKFEVIYINDCSEDDSLEKICSADKPENIRVLSSVPGSPSGQNKNRAVQYAINECRGEIIVSTDCDCIHESKWLASLLSYYDKKTAFVSGPVTFFHNKNIFEYMQTIEFAGLILTGAGLIGSNKPVICNAANLSFRKSVYMDIIPHIDDSTIITGDNEFLMRLIDSRTKHKIKFAFSKSATVYTYPNKSINQFLQQRRRWANNSLSYNNYIILSTLFLFFLGAPVQLLLGIIGNSIFFYSFLLTFSGKIIMEYLILRKGISFLFNELKITYFILAELLHIPYIIIAVVSGTFGNYEWKNRKLSDNEISI